jgi:hypothetical protein
MPIFLLTCSWEVAPISQATTHSCHPGGVVTKQLVEDYAQFHWVGRNLPFTATSCPVKERKNWVANGTRDRSAAYISTEGKAYSSSW